MSRGKVSSEKPGDDSYKKAEVMRDKRIQVAMHVQEIERGMEYQDLQKYVEE